MTVTLFLFGLLGSTVRHLFGLRTPNHGRVIIFILLFSAYPDERLKGSTFTQNMQTENSFALLTP